MSIAGLSEEQFAAALHEHLRPSRPIESFEHLYGREKQLEQIKQAMYSPGRHVFIYGDRGVGKTSLAATAAIKFGPSDGDPLIVACGTGSTFLTIVGEAVSQVSERNGVVASKETTKTTVGVKGLGYERTVQKDIGSQRSIHDLNSAVDAMKSLCQGESCRRVVVIDEFERLTDKSEQSRFAEFVKQLGDRNVNVVLIFCGIGKSLGDLIEAHGSAYRYLEGIRLERLNVGARWEIIDRSSSALGLTVNEDSRFRISAISDGYPHYVHLVCSKLYWGAFNNEHLITTLSPEDYVEAVKEACESIEAWLKQVYDKATKKDNDVYEEVLWALADHFELERNVESVYRSYLRIMKSLNKDPLTRTSFVSRLSNLKSERHGCILTSDRRSWYEFTENMVRGYVRLRAEYKGVRLAIEHEPSAEPPSLTVGKTRSKPVSFIDRPRFGGDPSRYIEKKDK